MPTAKRRAPQGMQSDKPVAVRFKPEEKQQLTELAERDGRTQGGFVRAVYLLGLEQYKARNGLD